MKMIKINSVLKDLVSSNKGIFNKLSQSPYSYDWASSVFDFDYVYSHSGQKYISPLIESLLDDNNELSEINLNLIISIIESKYKHKWGKLYSTYSLNYNPIENYSMEDHIETNSKVETKTTDNEVQTDIYAFNSSDPIPSAKSKGESVVTNEGNKDNNFSDHTRKGNIGVTSSQQLIESEIKLWQWNFIKEVYKDLDEELTIPIY